MQKLGHLWIEKRVDHHRLSRGTLEVDKHFMGWRTDDNSADYVLDLVQLCREQLREKEKDQR